MTDYVVGDIQGCYKSLRALLKKAQFDPTTDTLYCVGDLVNRGSDSLKTLRFIRDLGPAAKTVLGNHDLHLISLYYGFRKLKSFDTLKKLIEAKDADDLIEWLRQQPLMINIEDKNSVIVHAGLYPSWSVEQALEYSDEISTLLKSDKYEKLLKNMYGNTPDKYKVGRKNKHNRRRFTINAFTRMRYCAKNGRLDFEDKGPPAKTKGKLKPWFLLPHRRENKNVIFGHWSSLGLFRGDQVIAIDTGCVWGGKLTLYDIDNNRFIQQKSVE